MSKKSNQFSPEVRERAVRMVQLASLGRPVALNVASSNTEARALFEQFGFRLGRDFMGPFQGAPCSVATLSLK